MEFGGVPADLYAGYVDDDSDLEYSGGECSGDDSSDDPCSTKHAGHVSSSEDEFEREMNSEVMSVLELMASPAALQAVMKERKDKKQQQQSSRVSAKGKRTEHRKAEGDAAGQDKAKVVGSSSHVEKKESGGGEGEEKEAAVEYYDDIYFDSSSGESGPEEEEQRTGDSGRQRERKKVRKLTNDELFYDPHMDEEDEKWVTRQRMAYHNVKVSRDLVQKRRDSVEGQSSSSQPSTSADAQYAIHCSDAILSCPACMHTLCIDCQRHETYANQYRAMFVMNCRIMREEVLKYIPTPQKKGRKRKRKSQSWREGGTVEGDDSAPEAGHSAQKESQSWREGRGGGGGGDGLALEVYYPVRCSECNTEVAVYDKDEVFHFFNILASAP